MGAQHALRGYMVQSLIAVIDSFSDEKWESVTLEPNNESEKVDIKWTYPDGKKTAVQVKSSQNSFKYRQAKQWCEELAGSVTDTDCRLCLVGHVEEKLHLAESIGTVTILPARPLDISSLLDEASTRIDKFYEAHNRPKINASVRELLVQILVQDLNFAAMSGREIKRKEFEDQLIEWISRFERQIEQNPWIRFAGTGTGAAKRIENRIVSRILQLTGWNNFNEDETVLEFDEHLGKDVQQTLNFRGEIESPLIDQTDDFIMIKAAHDISYAGKKKELVKDHLEGTKVFVKQFRQNGSATPKRGRQVNLHSMLFALTASNEELDYDLVYDVKDLYTRDHLDDNIEYYLIDNARAGFLASAIISAKNFRPDLPVKFLYPITDLNSSPSKIGKRGLQLPPQYINSSVLPIVKESGDKISVLLYCAEGYNEDYVKKLIWLVISLTSGFANEYILFFPDYDERYSNEVKQVIRSFSDAELTSKLEVRKYERIDSAALADVKTTQQALTNQHYNETLINEAQNGKILNNAFIEILPYGNILMPFLKTEAISASDLKIFLSKKGIYVKNADKKRLITLLMTLLFSPGELEDFKQMIDIKEKPVKSAQEIYRLKENLSIDQVMNNMITINPETIVLNTETKILGAVKFSRNPDNPQEYVLDIRTEKKDPTTYLSVNMVYGKITISCKVADDHLLINSVKTITHDDKIIASRLLAAQRKELVEKNIIEEEGIALLFSWFKTNQDRVNFLLSFTNLEQSALLKSAEIKFVKYKFDKSLPIPDNLKERTERDIVTYLNGRDLGGLIEMSDDEFKKILLLDEITIAYTYDWLNLKGGLYNVKFNFSNSLFNKKGVEGAFRSEPALIMSYKVKALSNIDRLKRDLSNEIEDLKIAKLKHYNII